MEDELQFYLEMLGQECLEVAKCASKAKLFGLDDGDPSGNTTNAEDLDHEFNDLLAVVKKLNDLGVELMPNSDKIKAKLDKMEIMRKYAIERRKIAKRVAKNTIH